MLDAHCHIDLYPNPHRILDEIVRHNITTIAVTNLPSHFMQGKPHVTFAKSVRLALGLHPLFTHKQTQAELKKFRELAHTTSYIGEIGLDLSSEGQDSIEKQREHFHYALETIADRPRFVSIHSRRAEAEVLSILSEYGISQAVFHWYSGPKTLIVSIVKANHYFSINPAMIQSAKGRTIVESIPRERILTETDGPFVQIGNRPASPPDVHSVLTYLAELWGLKVEEVEQVIWQNFQRILQPIKEWQSQHAS